MYKHFSSDRNRFKMIHLNNDWPTLNLDNDT